VRAVHSIVHNFGSRIREPGDPTILSLLTLMVANLGTPRLTVSHWPYLEGCFLGRLLLWYRAWLSFRNWISKCYYHDGNLIRVLT
jgi:hypothetical protein